MKILRISFLLLIILWSCNQIKKDDTRTVFRYNESAGITSLDPAFAKDQANIWAVNQLFNGLVQLNTVLEIEPCIAKSWEISNNGLTYVFYLRNDVYFHDHGVFPKGKGRKVVAKDFVYSFNRILNPTVASPGAWIFGWVNNTNNIAFSASNDSTFEIRLKKAFPPFLGLLSMQYCSVVPWEAVKKFGTDFGKNPIGTGPFKFKMWKDGVKMVLLKNPNYFEFENDNKLPYLDAVSISFIIDKQSVFLEFVKGKLDFISGLDPAYKDELLNSKGQLNSKYSDKINLITEPYLNTEYLGIYFDTLNNSVKDNPLKNKLIRQAINMGFDRVKMIRYMRNNIGYPAVNGFIPKGLPSFDSALVAGYLYNPEMAKKLIKSAGYGHNKKAPKITLNTTSTYLDLCKYIQSQFAETGIDMEIEVTQPAQLREMVSKGKVPFFRGSWIADYPDAENYLSLFYSKNFSPNGPNYTHFKNQEFDALYEKANSEINDSVRYIYYRQMDRIIIEESPVIVLYYDQVLRFIQNDIYGLGSNPMNLLSLKRVKKIKSVK